jgi:hypothetical protein
MNLISSGPRSVPLAFTVNGGHSSFLCPVLYSASLSSRARDNRKTPRAQPLVEYTFLTWAWLDSGAPLPWLYHCNEEFKAGKFPVSSWGHCSGNCTTKTYEVQEAQIINLAPTVNYFDRGYTYRNEHGCTKKNKHGTC